MGAEDRGNEENVWAIDSDGGDMLHHKKWGLNIKTSTVRKILEKEVWNIVC